MLSQQVMNHLGVLYAHEETEHAQHASWHAEIQADAVGVTCPCIGPGANDHLVAGQILDDLIDERKHRGASAIDEALAANFDDVGIREDLHDRLIVEARHLFVVGGTGAGKTTFLNAIIAYLLRLLPHERLGTIEDELELQISALNLVRRVVRGRADMRRHVREMLRMRPDRIVVGEVRGAEALDLLKAWNTGHSGGFTTIHANSAEAALLRLESLIEEAGVPPSTRLIAEAVDLLIFISRRPDGARRIEEMVLVEGCAPDGGYRLKPIRGSED